MKSEKRRPDATRDEALTQPVARLQYNPGVESALQPARGIRLTTSAWNPATATSQRVSNGFVVVESDRYLSVFAIGADSTLNFLPALMSARPVWLCSVRFALTTNAVTFFGSIVKRKRQ